MDKLIYSRTVWIAFFGCGSIVAMWTTAILNGKDPDGTVFAGTIAAIVAGALGSKYAEMKKSDTVPAVTVPATGADVRVEVTKTEGVKSDA